MRRQEDALPSLDEFERIARDAWMALPETFRALAGDVVFRIEDLPDREILEDSEIQDPLELTGLYQGADLTEASITYPEPEIRMVFLFRLPILKEWNERGDVELGDLIAHVLVHEVGHHFGLSDEAMDAILEETE
jgi:predicted Zn-dependent protease with MMP-like domain